MLEVKLNNYSQECEVVDASGYVSLPDLEWEFVDKEGYIHRWEPGKNEGEWILSSLQTKTCKIPEICPECGRPTGCTKEVEYWVSKFTDEEIVPQYVRVWRNRKLGGITIIHGNALIPHGKPIPICGETVQVIHPLRFKATVTAVESELKNALISVVQSEGVE